MSLPPAAAGNKRKAIATSYLEENKYGSLSLPQKAANILQIICRRRANPAPTPTSSSAGYGELSTNGILKMAEERIRQCKNLQVAAILVDGLFDTGSGLSPEQSGDLELALLFQAAALKLSYRQFDSATRFLSLCQVSASPSGNGLHRTVSCLSMALQERIARELEGQLVPGSGKGNPSIFAVKDAFQNLQPGMIQCFQDLPYHLLTDLTAIQTIVDNVVSAKRVHLIDLGFKDGVQWPLLMQALAGSHGCSLELLKLTAIGTPEDNHMGKVLSSFAESMNIPFEFKLIVSELKDLREDFFELSDEETLAVHAEFCLSSLLSSPDHLVSLLGTIEKLNPCVMVLIETEASTDSPIFLDRFDAAVSFCAAVFDCLEDCLERNNPYRATVEGVISDRIRNAMTSEGAERVWRHEKLDFWRAFLSRFGLVEVALSDIAFLQLNLFPKSNPSRGSCTVEVNGKGILVGWKGSPIKSLSAWKFQHE